MREINSNSDEWSLIKSRLEKRLEDAKDGLTQMKNSREDDLILKAKVAIIKELLNLPRELEAIAANTKR